MSYLELRCITDEGVGAKPPASGDYGVLGAKAPAARRFFLVFWKKSYFNAIGSHFARVQSYLKELKF